MLRKQIPLTDRPVEQKKLFLRLLYKTFSSQEYLRFAMLDCRKSMQEQPDTEMDLETFIHNLNEDSGVRIQVGSPDPNLIYGAVFDVRLPCHPQVERLANFQMPYDTHHYKIMDDIITKSFESNIESTEGFCP